MLPSGSVLGNRWVIGKFVGEGACAKVYSVVDNKSPVDYETVAKVIALPKTSGKKDKEQERICNTLYYEYNLYTGLLNGFPFCPKTPLKFYGEDSGVRYLVMERLEADLVGYASRNNITPALLAEFGLQILDGLQWLHNKNFIFVDVKPENFMIKDCKLHFVDFGLVERYVASPTVNARAPGTRAAFAGTPTFCSLSVHKGGIPTGADDVEAMAYVLLSLLSEGRMPWSNAKSDQDCIRLKETCDITQLATERRCPELGQIIVSTRRLASGQSVDYAGCRQLMTHMKNRKDSGVTSPGGKRALSPKKGSRAAAVSATAAAEEEVEVVSPPKKKRTTATTAAAAKPAEVVPEPTSKRRRGAATSTVTAAAVVPATPSLAGRRRAAAAAPVVDLPGASPAAAEGPFSAPPQSRARASPVRTSARNALASPARSPVPAVSSSNSASKGKKTSAIAVEEAPFSGKTKAAASKATAAPTAILNWCLEVTEGPHAGDSFTVGPSGDKTAKVLMKSVGRGEDCDILLDQDEYLSENHLNVKIVRMKFHVQDNKSMNGSEVNGDKLVPNKWVEVSDGSSIKIGETEITIRNK